MEPREYDATLGGQDPCNAAVLGGIEGVKQRLVEGSLDECRLLIQALQYGDDGLALVRNHFKHPDHSQFFIDMVEAGMEERLSISQKRLKWTGPSVSVNDKKKFQDVIRKTQVNLVWDEMGTQGSVIYPAAYTKSQLHHFWLLTHQPNSMEAQGMAIAIDNYLHKGEPLSILAQSLLDQLKEFSEGVG